MDEKMTENDIVTFDPPKCVLCDETAITTAAQIPVCKKHYEEYANEAKQYLPERHRIFYKRLLDAG